MDEQSPSLEQTPEAPRPNPHAGRTLFSGDRLVAVFLISTLLGLLGTLIGFVPLIAIAMICPVVAASLP